MDYETVFEVTRKGAGRFAEIFRTDNNKIFELEKGKSLNFNDPTACGWRIMLSSFGSHSFEAIYERSTLMPLLSVNTLIDSDNIKAITSLSPGRPVFLVLGTDNSHVVIKQEITTQAHDPVNLKFANKAMKAVSPATQSKVLTNMELTALQLIVQLETDVAQMTFKPIPPDIVYLNQVLLQGGAWFKMDKADGIVDLQGAVTKATQNQDKSGVRQIAAALSAPNGLESLGKILAADFFNGNTDRFDVQNNGNGGTGNPNPRGGNFQVLINLGNVLFSTQNGALQALGLDAYEALGTFRHLDQTVAVLENNSGEQWSGRRLAANQAQWRLQFATLCIADLEAALGPRNRKVVWGKTNRLPNNAAQRLANGIDLGITDLQNKLGPWRNKVNCPAGLLDRLNVLNW